MSSSLKEKWTSDSGPREAVPGQGPGPDPGCRTGAHECQAPTACAWVRRRGGLGTHCSPGPRCLRRPPPAPPPHPPPVTPRGRPRAFGRPLVRCVPGGLRACLLPRGPCGTLRILPACLPSPGPRRASGLRFPASEPASVPPLSLPLPDARAGPAEVSERLVFPRGNDHPGK